MSNVPPEQSEDNIPGTLEILGTSPAFNHNPEARLNGFEMAGQWLQNYHKGYIFRVVRLRRSRG
jgi:hypothetical protein